MTKSIRIPSGSSSGIKVDLSSMIPAVEGDTTTIVADIDVNQNFHIQFAPGSTTTVRQMFSPVSKEKARQQKGRQPK
jgi:hypothetical protein